MKKVLILSLILGSAISAKAAIFYDDFDGNTNTNLSSGMFDTLATTGFTFWPVGTSGDMDAGYFSVINRAVDVHSQFTNSYDADNNSAGHYAIYNGFSQVNGLAYSVNFTGLTVGEQYSFGAMFITLASNPPYPDVSNLRFQLDGNALGSDFTLVPVPSGSEFWNDYGRTFTATSTSHTLSILNVGSPSGAGNDFGLDNVVFDVSPVPEPLSITAIAIGAMAMRRRRKAS